MRSDIKYVQASVLGAWRGQASPLHFPEKPVWEPGEGKPRHYISLRNPLNVF